jgi:hypothetical protein
MPSSDVAVGLIVGVLLGVLVPRSLADSGEHSAAAVVALALTVLAFPALGRARLGLEEDQGRGGLGRPPPHGTDEVAIGGPDQGGGGVADPHAITVSETPASSWTEMLRCRRPCTSGGEARPCEQVPMRRSPLMDTPKPCSWYPRARGG